MERYPEVVGDLGQHLLHGKVALLRSPLLDVPKNLRGAAARALRPSLAWDQPAEPFAVVGFGQVVEGGATDAEAIGRLAHWEGIRAVPAKHLVADLQEVAGVEEGVGAEEVVANLLRVRVEHAAAAQVLFFRVGALGCSQRLSPGKRRVGW